MQPQHDAASVPRLTCCSRVAVHLYVHTLARWGNGTVGQRRGPAHDGFVNGAGGSSSASGRRPRLRCVRCPAGAGVPTGHPSQHPGSFLGAGSLGVYCAKRPPGRPSWESKPLLFWQSSSDFKGPFKIHISHSGTAETSEAGPASLRRAEFVAQSAAQKQVPRSDSSCHTSCRGHTRSCAAVALAGTQRFLCRAVLCGVSPVCGPWAARCWQPTVAWHPSRRHPATRRW